MGACGLLLLELETSYTEATVRCSYFGPECPGRCLAVRGQASSSGTRVTA